MNYFLAFTTIHLFAAYFPSAATSLNLPSSDGCENLVQTNKTFKINIGVIVPFNHANKFSKARIEPSIYAATKDMLHFYSQNHPSLYAVLKVSFFQNDF